MPDERDERRRAVALHYEAGQDLAPRIVAKGEGHVADSIIELARQHGVHIRQDRELVAVLAKLDLDTVIPPELYRVVAAILVFVYRLSGRVPAGTETP
jgi:flagellar biosynthesis protein